MVVNITSLHAASVECTRSNCLSRAWGIWRLTLLTTLFFSQEQLGVGTVPANHGHGQRALHRAVCHGQAGLSYRTGEQPVKTNKSNPHWSMKWVTFDRNSLIFIVGFNWKNKKEQTVNSVHRFRIWTSRHRCRCWMWTKTFLLRTYAKIGHKNISSKELA